MADSNSKKVSALATAGFIASLAMLGTAYLLRLVATNAPDFAAQFGAVINKQIVPDAYSRLWWEGLFWHVVGGVFVLPLAFDFLSDKALLTTKRPIKGLAFGGAIWLFFGLTVAPLAGQGFFFQEMPDTFSIALMALLCWCIYAMVLDQMIRANSEHQEVGRIEKHAA